MPLEIQLSRGGLTLVHFRVIPKSGPGCPSTYVVVVAKLYDLRRDVYHFFFLNVKEVLFYQYAIPLYHWFRFMVFNATFNNISDICWRSVLLVKEIGVPGENYRHVASQWQTSSHNVVSSTLHRERSLTLEFQFKLIKPIFKWMLYPCLQPVNHLSTQA